LNGLQRNGPARISVKESGPLVASLLVESEAPGCVRLVREYRLHALRNYVEIMDLVDKKAVRAKEGVHFGYAFQVPGGTVRMDVPWAVVRPDEDQIPGACRNWFTVQRWVDISNGERGITWLTPDAPLVQIGGITANLIGSLSDPRAWLEDLSPSTHVYSWAMNNHWHTNYRAEQEGPTTFRFVVVPHQETEAGVEAYAARLSLEHSQPVLVLPARGDNPVFGRRPLDVRGIGGKASVQVTAFKPSEDGRAWIVRLFGSSGKPEQVELGWNGVKPRSLWLSDNSEQRRERLDGPVEVPAWAIVTVRAER